VAQLGARLDGIEEVEGSNPFGSTSSNLCLRPLNREQKLPRSAICFQEISEIELGRGFRQKHL
jgi:hypothetical protein